TLEVGRYRRALHVGDDRKTDGECGAGARTAAFRPNTATVRFDQLPRNEQSETEAAGAPRGGAFGLPEALEDLREESAINAAAVVGDPHFHRLLRHVDIDRNPTARCGELHCIRKEIGEYLFEPARISSDRHARMCAEPDFETFRLGQRQDRLDRAADTVAQVETLQIEGRTTRHDTRDIEQLIDHLRLTQRIVANGLDGTWRLNGIQRAPAQHRGPAENRRERRAQFV